MKFDEQFVLLREMRGDAYYPPFLVDKVEALLKELIAWLEAGNRSPDQVQEKLDEMTCGINDLQEEFDGNDSEIETVARDSIAVSVERILCWFGADIDLEEALRERDW